MRISTPGRAAYLSHALRSYKHNAFKWVLGWLVGSFVSNGDDGVLCYNYLLLLLISHLSKQSVASLLLPWR